LGTPWLFRFNRAGENTGREKEKNAQGATKTNNQSFCLFVRVVTHEI
jgi:hypothetical protein